MSTNRINTALVGEGRVLSDILAGLAARSNHLRLQILAVIDLSPQEDSSALDHARELDR